MQNRFLKRLLYKYLNFESDEQLSVVYEWLAKQLKGEPVPDPVTEFYQGFNEFFKAIGKAFDEFDRVIIDREKALEINERELSKINDYLQAESSRNRAVIEHLKFIVSGLKDELKISPGEQSDTELIESLVDRIDRMIISHRRLIGQLENIFETSNKISACKNERELYGQMRRAFNRLAMGTKIKAYRRVGDDKYQELEDRSGSTKEVAFAWDLLTQPSVSMSRSDEQDPALIVVITEGPFADFMESGAAYAPVRALMPAILSTLEIFQLIEQETKRVAAESELKTAKLVQLTLMPKYELITTQGLNLIGSSQAAKECGGDWWNHYQLKPHLHLLMIGDVTGHGVASALVTAAVKGYCDSIRFSKKSEFDLKGFMIELNEVVAAFEKECGRSMSLAAFIVNSQDRSIQYTSCGHPPCFIVRKSRQVLPLDLRGPLLGFQENQLDIEFAQQLKVFQGSLQSGDRLVMYTDGITEAENPSGELYGEMRLYKSLTAIHQQEVSIQSAIADVLENLQTFTKQAALRDDITLVFAEVA